MAVLKRYICSKHGEFDGWSDGVRCPALKCRCKPREMVSAPAVHREGRTAGIDKKLGQLAIDFKMTDIKSTKEGDHQTGYHTRNNTQPAKNQTGVMWGDNGRFALNNIVKTGAATSIRGEDVGVRVTGGTAPGLRSRTLGIKDPDNLTIK